MFYLIFDYKLLSSYSDITIIYISMSYTDALSLAAAVYFIIFAVPLKSKS